MMNWFPGKERAAPIVEPASPNDTARLAAIHGASFHRGWGESEFEAMLAGASDVAGKADLLVCPPATLIAAFAEKAQGKVITVGAQDCHPKASGAHTGDISAEMLADVGATAIIVGHSERRADHGESDVLVRQKAEAVWRAGLTAIVCIGETQHQRDAGQTLDICRGQLNVSLPEGAKADNLVVAYEPVWAIGTGLTPTAADVEQIHTFIRELLIARFSSEGAVNFGIVASPACEIPLRLSTL